MATQAPAASVRVAIVGLGYVGLPLALALARHYDAVGFDIDGGRIADLRRGHDATGETPPTELRATSLRLGDDADILAGCDIYVVTVPTPVDADNRPDLRAVISACAVVGGAMAPGAVVVFESTVYPGVTEDVCGPALEAASGLRRGVDFFLGYSPERINPGDRAHTVDRITKVVAGETPEVTARLADLYGRITGAGVFEARDIRTAEAAKVIENAQRDINIAFINEVAVIFNRLGLSTHDVLAAARTKWNFLDFQPGLVGGHCIGVDPFYLAHAAAENGYQPEVILSGRRINDNMAGFCAERIDQVLRRDVTGDAAGNGAARVLVLGLAFKENVPDLRNAKSVDLVRGLEACGHTVDVHDAMADPAEAEALYGLRPITRLEPAGAYDCVVGAVPHAVYIAFSGKTLAGLVREGGLVADLKGMWRHVQLPAHVRRWEL